ncbi:Double-stranded RNA-binding domain [Cinara cedri]|uniref:Double-stranded RNA-binding domain n=1 Tax=Cinara cedri TaxID=506608 RepID=A0A5E4NTA0_9HEMI|nr:Double-stranded RNA-binding domain [Cinara cedri]
MEYNQYFSDITNFNTIIKTPIIYLKKILANQGILNQLVFESIQTTGILNSRFQYRVTDGRFIAFGIGESENEAKENAAKSLLRVILKDFPELCSKHSRRFCNTYTLDSNVTHNSKELLNANEYNTIGLHQDYKHNSIGLHQDCEHNSIRLLQELCLYFNLPSPIYILESSEGPLHSKVHTISCSVLHYVVNGIGNTRKMAKCNAADKLYLKLKNMPAKYLQNQRN